MRRYLLVALAVALVPVAAGIFAVANSADPAAALTPTPTGAVSATPTATPTGAFPDLRVGSVSIGYATFDACFIQGNLFGLRVNVLNSGDTAAGTFVVNANGYEQTVPGLAAGANVMLLFPNYVYMGVNNVTVDSTNVITENNESNNTFSQQVAVPTQPLPCTPTITPTPTATPTPTVTPEPCAGQQNTDANLIDTSPPKLYDDLTVANSDALCDDVDDDDDNDGLTDAAEVTGTACSGTITNPLLADTDGDHALDGAECALGTDPTDGTANEPSIAQCIAATSTGTPDSDAVIGWREYCYYNTSHTTLNTDGDTKTNGAQLNDGCEIYSINGDQVVNVVDLQQIAIEFAAYGPPPPDYPNNATYRLKVNLDVTKDGAINVADLQQTAAAIPICG